jgi:class 3 adenylate cyclase
VGEIGRLAVIYEHEAQLKVFEPFDPEVERWAADRVETLERDVAKPLEHHLNSLGAVERSAARFEQDAADLIRDELPAVRLYIELIDEVGDMRRDLQEYRLGIKGAAARFGRDVAAFERFLSQLRPLEAEAGEAADLDRVEALSTMLRDGGKEIFDRYDATRKREVLTAIDELEHGLFADIEQHLNHLVASSKDDANAALASLTELADANERLLWLALGVMLLLALAITYFANHSIAQPIRHLHAMMLELTRGNNQVTVTHTKRRDEIGDMAQALQVFKENAIRLDEKTVTLEALPAKLGKYLSPQVYSLIFHGQKQVEVRAERKKLTIFFSDLVNFTQTTGDLEPEEIAALLNSYLTEMSTIALASGATIDKFVGDAMLIFFGDPETRGVAEDARACVSMAIAMQRRLAELQRRWHEEGKEHPLEARIGINTGYCDVGNFGSAERMDYTIIGGAVNLASRLQSLAEPGGIVLSYETWALTNDIVKAEACDPIHVKGIRRELVPYRVVGVYDDLEAQGRVFRRTRPGLDLRLDLDALREGKDADADVLDATSHPRSLLSIARLNRARSRVRLASCNLVRIAQTCFGRRGGFCPVILPLFQGRGRTLVV